MATIDILRIVGITVLLIFCLILFIACFFDNKKCKKAREQKYLETKRRFNKLLETDYYQSMEKEWNRMVQANKDLIEWMDSKK